VDEIILLNRLQNKNYHEVEVGEPGLYFAKSWIQPRMVVVVVVPPCESNTYELFKGCGMGLSGIIVWDHLHPRMSRFATLLLLGKKALRENFLVYLESTLYS
jgi:hypothetical protein